MDTDDTDDVVAHSWLVVLTIRASDLSGLSCRPFCRYYCLTSVVHSARMDSPAGVLSARMARWSCVSSAYAKMSPHHRMLFNNATNKYVFQSPLECLSVLLVDCSTLLAHCKQSSTILSVADAAS